MLKIKQNKKFRKFYHQILLFDPGLQSLHRALRTVSSACTAVLLAYLTFRYLLPGNIQAAPILAGFMGMMPTFAINDSNPKTRMKILFISGFTVAFAITIGSVVHANMLLHNCIFLLIVFMAFYLRKYSLMFIPVGMITFIGYYFTFFLPMTIPLLPYFLLAIGIGVCTAFVFMFLIFPQRQKDTITFLYHSWETQAASFCTYAIDVLHYGRYTYYKNLDNAISQLTKMTTALTDQLPDGEMVFFRKRVPAQQVQVYLFDSILALNTMYRFFKEDKIEALGIKDRDTLIEVMKLVRKGFRMHTLQIKEEMWNTALEKVHYVKKRNKEITSLSHLKNSIRWLSNDLQLFIVPQNGYRYAQQQIQTYTQDYSGTLSVTTTQAIKAVIAVAISIIIGNMFPMTRPYWIIQTAFVVMVNAETVGQIYNRGLFRLLGTLFGAILGFVLIVSIAKLLVFKFIFLFISIFLAFYLFSRSYAYMSFWITVMLAFLYDILMGGVPEKILILRVIDTVIGVGIGFLVSFLILPRKEPDVFRNNVYEYLKQLELFLKDYKEHLKTQKTHILVNEVLALTVKLQQIRDIITTMKPVPGYDHNKYNEIALLVRSLNYQVAHLQSPSSRWHMNSEDKIVYTYCKKIINLIKNNIENITGYIDSPQQLRPAFITSESVIPDTARNDKHTFLIVHHLAHINELIIRLGTVIEERKMVR